MKSITSSVPEGPQQLKWRFRATSRSVAAKGGFLRVFRSFIGETVCQLSKQAEPSDLGYALDLDQRVVRCGLPRQGARCLMLRRGIPEKNCPSNAVMWNWRRLPRRAGLRSWSPTPPTFDRHPAGCLCHRLLAVSQFSKSSAFDPPWGEGLPAGQFVASENQNSPAVSPRGVGGSGVLDRGAEFR